MLDSALMLQAAAYANYTVRGDAPELLGNASPAKLPTSDSYPTKHGHILIAALTEKQQRAVFETIGIGHLLDDPRFVDSQARTANLADAKAEFTKAFAAKTNVEWVAELTAAGVPAQPILTIPETAADPQLEHRRVRVKSEGIDGFDGPLDLLGVPFDANADQPTNEAAPPVHPGQHNDEVLAELGYSADEIAGLKQAGALG